ncbi:recombinase family protein [Streptomyces sp. NPDC001530]|uniref:recombinase family protein n=1 Tax=Streptomyces sp. NPDC001530 TaxID=3364582 RepID=UPI0036CD985E
MAGYIRVSTGGQLDGFGLEDQEQIVRRWAREYGHRFVKLFVEKAVPGTVAGDERPQLGAALSWIEDKKVHGLVAPNLDRLARELVVQEAALAQTWKHGGRAFMADQGEILPDDPEDPMRTAMRQMMGVFARLDRGMTVATLRRGRRIKGEKGEYAYGPPYGWQAHKKELTPEEMEQAGRARGRRLRDEDGLSYREIAAVLEAEGIRPKRGDRWHPETVRRMLANTQRPAADPAQAHRVAGAARFGAISDRSGRSHGSSVGLSSGDRQRRSPGHDCRLTFWRACRGRGDSGSRSPKERTTSWPGAFPSC